MLLLWSGTCVKTPLVDKFYDITVINNSMTEIRIFLADEYSSKQYPDTSLPLVKPILKNAGIGESCYFDSRTPWEENIRKLPADTLSVYIISNIIYEQQPWDSIRINYNILRRLDLSIEDLKALDFKIRYQ